MLLEVKDVTVCYDTAMVLDRVSLRVGEGELIGLVGPNGAGKTSLLRAVAGLVKWDQDTLKGTTLSKITFEGSIIFDGKEIKGLPSHEIAKRGFRLCPERGKPFRELTVHDNLLAGAYLVQDKKEVERNLKRVYELFPRLKEREKQVAGTLSGGERTMLALGRAFMYRPKLLMIDEPSTGLAPRIKDDLFVRVKEIFKAGTTILLTEQDVSFAFALSDRNYVVSRGHIIAEGTAEELIADETIRKTYVGL